MRRTVILVLVLGMLALVPIGTASADDGPGSAVTWATPSDGSPARGYGRTGMLPLHQQALERAKQHASAKAPKGRPGGGGGGPTSTTGWEGQYDPQVAPPDATGAIGPSSYVELINLRFGIYGRDGSAIASGQLSALTNQTQSCLSDPQVIWDADGQRFYYLALNTCTNTFAWGFSKTSSPTGASDAQWCKYTAFQYGSTLPDYPKLGDSGDFLLVGANIFQPTLFSYTYLRSDVDWISKATLQLGAGGACPDPAGIAAGAFLGPRDALGSLASTPVPANGVERGASEGYVVADPDASSQPGGNASYLSLFRVSSDASGNAVLSAPTTVPIASYSVPANAPQPKTRKLLDTMDGRLTQAVAAVDPSEGTVGVWTQHTVFGGAGAEVRWYEIDGASGALLDFGKASSSSLYTFNGAVSPDRAVPGSGTPTFGSSMAMTFNTSSSNAYPAIQYVAKAATGQSGFTKVVQSAGANLDFSCSSACRWGDYAGASPDPVSTGGTRGRVWMANQWNVKSVTGSDVDWRTWFFSVAL
jgi:hypothetical protein